MRCGEINILKDLTKEKFLQPLRPRHDYDIQKTIETFKKLNCEVYITQNCIRLLFPKNINSFHEKELSLIFRKAINDIGETLRFRNLQKLRTKGPNDWVRVI